jgi:hypothetical protein
MKPKLPRFVLWLAMLPVAFVLCVWISGANYDIGISPTGVHTINDFIQRFGEPRTFNLCERDGRTYYEFIGIRHYPFSLSIPSNSPRYVFDAHGNFVDWYSGLSEEKTYQFDKRWQRSTNGPVPFSDVKQKLGL